MMKRKELEEILIAHANALNEGIDMAAALLARYPERAAELAPLFQLARAIQGALQPVPAPAVFKTRLRQRLQEQQVAGRQKAQAARSAGRGMVWWGVAAAGSALSIAGLALFVLRRLRLAQARRTQPATATVA
ncbi:MAG: hypothetical protein L0332_04490 [Chloroflexi bacterium]|nr:hypothetical protein [Chloroflexota bacterium]MCI0580126.1 hypothetical protein [Chloroflexota bacterium]MCI0649298.1 hypothetical protein [Chloroflexota bacterium]MCI0725969.1 hypothetical protein [Chloroflexota bacterium]